MTDAADFLHALVREVLDWPRPGIRFKDLTPLFADPVAFATVVRALADGAGPIDVVAGVEARGFVLAAPVAIALGVGFVPIRKAGKLPRATVRAEYALEYGTDVLELHADAVRVGQRVLIVDDVLASGGTARAAAGLVDRLGGRVSAIAVLAELAGLGGRDRVAPLPVRALVSWSGPALPASG
ncbi:MAG: adenine phosphoribosyltransferase [Mycobacteriales bacterium]